ncbi:methyl-accepting chemotaxis protein [Oryzibacter oryziterrae]|uniref:methyl-accepting chemotaxis protein n=1 Tax=Oryzibacter oryziterrae TaxID=2766474 RepID=UPI002101E47D|nr:methyl-accepting chemotaxis protein [Oryzibacter oryziterrae]
MTRRWTGSIKTVLALATGLLVAIGLAQGVAGFFIAQKLQDKVEIEAANYLPSVDLLGQVQFDLIRFRLRMSRHILVTSEADLKAVEDQCAETLAELAKDRAAAEALLIDPAEQATYRDAFAAYDPYKAQFDQLIALSRKGDKDGATKLLNGELKVLSEKLLGGVEALLQDHRQEAAAAHEEAKAEFLEIRLMSLGLAAVCLVLGAATVLFVRRRVAAPVVDVTMTMTRISEGHLDTDVPHTGMDNEIGGMAQALLVFRDRLVENERLRKEQEKSSALIERGRHGALESLKVGANMVADLNDIAVDLTALNRNMAQVTSGAQTIATASAELVSSVEAIAANSDGVAADANATDQTAVAGRGVVAKVASAVGNIASAVDETARSVDQLSEASGQIAQILAVIEGIASQTNLLALNATIESARAGEAGRGFGVVAAEVKGLANQTSRATDDISHRISVLKGGMDQILKTMAASKSAVGEGQASIAEALAMMEQISSQVGSVNHRMRDISGILRQQREAVEEISKSINTVADTATDNEGLLHTMSGKMRGSNDRFSQKAASWHNDGDDASLCEIAKIDHVLFKKKVIDAVMGALEWRPSEVTDHHNCRLGKWYDGMRDPEVRNQPAFIAILGPHERVHNVARQVLEARAAGQPDKMMAALAELNHASADVVERLEDLSAYVSARQDRLAASGAFKAVAADGSHVHSASCRH